MRKSRMRAVCLALALLLTGGTALGEQVYYSGEGKEAWYQDMLKDGILSVGNNRRLKDVIRRAQDGETVTVATIGGSITEGAGAAKYAECYASRFAAGFAARYGAGDNVKFVNAGVGGTPSTFGLMRYDRDVAARVKDDDGLADLVIVEFAVNDYQEPTKHRCYESLVKKILSQENKPAVILLFSVFKGGFNLQGELKKVGETYDLMMVSIKDAAYPHIGKELSEEEFFFDQYHPTSMGHGIMADCLLAAVEEANGRETDEADINLDAESAYGTEFMNLMTLYGSSPLPADVELIRGGFAHDDTGAYSNLAVGRVCGENFHHSATDTNDPLVFRAAFRKLLIAWRAVSDPKYGEAEIWVDGKLKRTLKGAADKWGQSEVTLLWDAKEPAEHKVEIRMSEETKDKRFTITAIGYAP